MSGVMGDAGAERAVDGRTDGDFGRGSVTHSGADTIAWFEIDLGSSEEIDRVHLWNRTDCCQTRRSNFWLLVSDQPFPDRKPAEALSKTPGVWGRFNLFVRDEIELETEGAKGRCVRVQLGGANASSESYLSLAEVQVLQRTAPHVQGEVQRPGTPRVEVLSFNTDKASRFDLHLKSDTAVDVVFSLWRHPNLVFGSMASG